MRKVQGYEVPYLEFLRNFHHNLVKTQDVMPNLQFSDQFIREPSQYDDGLAPVGWRQASPV